MSIVVFLLALLLGACRTYSGPLSDHYDGEMFLNPWKPQKKSFIDLIRWKLTTEPDPWPSRVENNQDIVVPDRYQRGNVEVTFINHASFLITINQINLLVDPMWSERTSPFNWIGPKRVRDPGLAFDSLPPIHYVLITHNHYDHLDLPTLKQINERHKATFIVPLGDKNWLEKEGLQKVEEMDWWQTIQLVGDVKLHFAPSQHASARGLFDRNQSLWGAFAIEYNNKSIYVAGDTGYGPQFVWAAQKLPPIELALLPIGAYEPRWLVEYLHMNPEDSVKAFVDLKARFAMAKHFGCWQLTDEAFAKPADDLTRALNQSSSKDNFLIPEVGGTYRYAF